jgi:hypothetical protein
MAVTATKRLIIAIQTRHRSVWAGARGMLWLDVAVIGFTSFVGLTALGMIILLTVNRH